MGKFAGKKERSVPQPSMMSLSDLVFAFLFFIMMVTSMREVTLMVRFRAPHAVDIQKLEKKSLVTYIYIGEPVDKYKDKFGSATRIQLNDQFAEIASIQDYIAQEKSSMKEEDQPLMTVCIKADKDTKMGTLTDVKQALREAYALKISYAAVGGGL